MSDHALEQFRDERVGKLEKRLDLLEPQLTKLEAATNQVSAALDNLGKGQEKLRADMSDAFAETQKKISEATVHYINERLGGGGNQQGQIVTAGQPQQKRGGLDGLFDKLGPTIDKVLTRYGDNANLPFLGPSQPELNTEIVDLERQVKTVTTQMYRNELRGVLNRVNIKLGLPTVPASEAVRVGASHA